MISRIQTAFSTKSTAGILQATQRDCFYIMTKVASLFLWSSLVSSVAAAGESILQPEWTKPKQVGDKVPDVTFATRVRIESDDENPFAWKGTYQAVTFLS
jgi:hypothetical protein